jgi:hypothetical protein
MPETSDDRRYRMQMEQKKRIAEMEASTAKEAAEYNNAMQSGEVSPEMEKQLKAEEAERNMDRNMSRDKKMSGGEMQDDEREGYFLGSVVKAVAKAGKKAKVKTNKELDKLSGVDAKTPGRTAEGRGVVVGKKRTEAFKTTEQLKGGAKAAVALIGGKSAYDVITAPEESRFKKEFASAQKEGLDVFDFTNDEGKTYPVKVALAAEDNSDVTYTRTKKAEGGSLLTPPEMEMEEDDDMPVDTYDNIPEDEKEEVEASQLPDEEMENDYTVYVLGESLDSEDQEYLMSVLETDERLSSIFDKVMDVAGEFAGEGAVDGPGDGTSDSIPARLSDGEFVFTKKATDQMGADQLQTMMDEAEKAYDGGLMKKAFGGMVDDVPMDETPEEENINSMMIDSNQMPSVRPR